MHSHEHSRIYKILFLHNKPYNKMAKYLIALVICIQLITRTMCLVPTTSASIYDGKYTYTILISSGLRWGLLKVHCRAYGTTNDDVKHILEPRQSFRWDFDFKLYFAASAYYTTYECDFNWTDQHFSLNAWNGNNWGTCDWAVLEDGFYFRCIGAIAGNWEKRFTWDGSLHLGPRIDDYH